MANCLYNGAILPALPKNAYPYSAIHINILSATEYMAELVCSTCALTFSDGFISSSLIASEDGTLTVYTANQAATEWKQGTDGEKNFTAGESVYSFALGDLKWSNYDILNTDGTLYLAASDPIPIPAPVIDPLSMWLGYQAGQWVVRQRGKKKTPVAYLYNGVRLPTLPEWDKAKYPYAFILKDNDSQTEFELYCLAAEATYGRASLYMGGEGADFGSPKLRFGYTDDGVWSGLHDATPNAILGGLYRTIVWSNYDVYYGDMSSNGSLTGSLYCAASDPIPVYA